MLGEQCRFERVFLSFILLLTTGRLYIGTDLPVDFYLQLDPIYSQSLFPYAKL
jgi:hypothetical protein